MEASYFDMVTGRAPAELRIDNVRIVDVLCGEVREGSVCVGGGRILGFSKLEDGRWFVDLTDFFVEPCQHGHGLKKDEE